VGIERFVVDARLLRELGERLVGQPHIALAELIKNSYDADARVVDIYFTSDSIRVVDDGHGMSHTDFSERWLTIGTTIKERDRESPELGRPFTGSKGVGRLSVQLLATRLELRTVGLRNPRLTGRRQRMSATGPELYPEVVASVDWEKAVQAGHIEDVEVNVEERAHAGAFAAGSPCGTEILLTSLSHHWDAHAFRELARELWPLQPPFADQAPEEAAFQVNLHSPYEDVVREFNSQMRAILDIWIAKVTGRLLPRAMAAPSEPVYDLRANDNGTAPAGIYRHTEGSTRLLHIKVEIRGGPRRELTFRIPDCHVDRLSYEIRIFNLTNRLPRGVKVDIARQYMHTYGGVHIYDANFHLPYYGPDTDWLKIEQDHARRLSASRLLPTELQVQRGMLDLVPNSRIYGAVQISTTHEAQIAESAGTGLGDVLTVQITRDRLVDNRAFDDLILLVRAGMDLYAMESAREKFSKANKRRSEITKPPSTKLKEAEESLGSIRDVIPEEDLEEFDRLRDQVDDAIADSEALERAVLAQTSLLAGLATAGMIALAYEHEMSKQTASIETLARRVNELANSAPGELRESLIQIAADLDGLAMRTRRIRAIFAPLSDEELRTSDIAGTVKNLITELDRSLSILSRGTKIDYSRLPSSMTFPRGGYIAWWSILQNILLNALNATLDSTTKLIKIDAAGDQRAGWIRVQDTGSGIDLDDAERMFEPFERGMPVSREKAGLVLGGTGLGLTIVRLVANELGVMVAFEPPDDGFSASIRIFWKQDRRVA
jgi:signal transduction histidine kinase